MSDSTQSRIEPDGGTEVAGELPADDHGHDFPPLSSVKRWFITTNHKDIGVLYIATSLFFLLFGGLLALLFRAQLWAPRAAGEGILSAAAYNQAVSAHGLIMVFWFLSPFAFGFANYIVPLQIGAKDLAFPRLNALSYWLYTVSGILFGISFFQGGTFSGGWTMYAPLNVPTYMPDIGATTAVMALALFVISVTVSSVNFLTTMHRMRAEGLTLRNLPLFTWSILLTTWMMLFAFAALLAALIIMLADRTLGTTYYISGEGGALLWTHLWWFFGHPEVYIVFFPALGVMAETFQTFTGRRLVGRKWFIASMLLVAIQSFLVWMHHMFLTAINLQVKTLFMATTIGISLPFDLMMFALIYTLIKGRIRFTTPFLYNLGAVILFIVGGITGVFLGAVVLDYEFRGTYWVVAHFHYVMLGGGTALLGGLFYWFPKITGRMYDRFLGKLSFVVFFIGFNLLYFPQFIAWETPRRVFNYPEAFTTMHQLSTIGAFVISAGIALILYNLGKSAFVGEEVDGNPWEYASTTEWAVPSPPPLENYPGIPTFKSGSLDFVDSLTGATSATDGGEVTDGGVATTEAHETTDDHVSHASIWPFAIAVGAFFTLLGFSAFDLTAGGYPAGMEGSFYLAATLIGVAISVVGFISLGLQKFHGPTGPFGESWPFGGTSNLKTGVWIFMASDVVVFGAFIGSYIFMRVAHGWTEWHVVPHDPIPGLMNTYILLASSFTVVLALVAAEKRNRVGVVTSLLATVILGFGFLGNKAIEWNILFAEGETLSSSIFTSTFFLTTGLHAAHVIAGLLIAFYLIPRAWNGAYLGDEDSKYLEFFGIYWHFVDIVWLFLFPLFYIL